MPSLAPGETGRSPAENAAERINQLRRLTCAWTAIAIAMGADCGFCSLRGGHNESKAVGDTRVRRDDACAGCGWHRVLPGRRQFGAGKRGAKRTPDPALADLYRR